MYSEQLMRSMHSEMRKDAYLLEVFNSMGMSIDMLDTYIKDVGSQMDIDTATWGIDVYEREAGIPIDYTKSYVERRAMVKAKWRSSGKADIDLIQQVADAWENGNVNVTFEADGLIHVTFVGEYGTPQRLDGLEKAIDEVKPAHLGIVYHFMYLLVKDIQAMQINTLQQTRIDAFAFKIGE